MKRSLVVVFVLLMVFSALPALGHGANDPDEVEGFLDIARVEFKGQARGTNTVTVITQEGFACNYLNPSDDNYLKLQFDKKSNGSIDLVGTFRCVDNKLYLALHGKKTGSDYEEVRAKRPRANTTKVTFPFDIPELDANHVSLIVKTKDHTNVGCIPAACRDRFPDSGEFSLY